MMNENTTSQSNTDLHKIVIIVLSIAAALAVITAVIFLATKSGRELNKQLNLGQKYLAEMNYEEAIASFEKALEIDPMSVDAYIGIADAYIAMAEGYEAAGDIDSAKEALEEAIAILEDGIETLKKAQDSGNKKVTDEDIERLEEKLEEVNKNLDKIVNAEIEEKATGEETGLVQEENENPEEEYDEDKPYYEIQPFLDATIDAWGKNWDDWTVEELIAKYNVPQLGAPEANGDRYFYSWDESLSGYITSTGSEFTAGYDGPGTVRLYVRGTKDHEMTVTIASTEKVAGNVENVALYNFCIENDITSMEKVWEYFDLDETDLKEKGYLNISTDVDEMAAFNYSESNYLTLTLNVHLNNDTEVMRISFDENTNENYPSFSVKLAKHVRD